MLWAAASTGFALMFFALMDDYSFHAASTIQYGIKQK